jgi:hypothetical protein
MKKFILVLVLVICCTFTFVACSDNTEDTEDIPLPAQTIEISTVEDLCGINNYLGSQYINYTFSLQNDIDLSSINQWVPIGNSETSFMSVFEGNDFSINNLTYTGLDETGEPTVTELNNNVALFGYTHNATISNLNLNNIDIDCYSSGDYFYSAGLVSYNIGISNFNNIAITGDINVSNVYTYNTTYGMDGVVQDDHVLACNTTQFIGGLVAYSAGNTVFTNINIDVDISNNNFHAVYEKVEKEVDGEIVVESEGYSINSYSSASFLPAQSLVGLMAGEIKSGGEISGITITGDLEILAKSIYASSGISILIDSDISDVTASNCNIICKASEKAGISGAIALIDSSNVSNIRVSYLSILAEPIADSIKNISIGGVASYCYDGAVLTDGNVTSLTVEVIDKDSLQLGGVVGVVRDATLTKSNAVGTFVINARKVISTDYINTASIVYSVYGNSIVTDCTGNINNTLVDSVSGTTLSKNTAIYGISSSTTYVNEDGKTVLRFATEDSIKDYVEVFVTHDNANEIIATYYNDEGVELGTITFTVDDSQYTSDGENCVRFMAAYYTEGIGLLNNDGTVLDIDGRNFAEYIQITGVPIYSNNSIIL